MENKPKRTKFIMDPQWIVEGSIDSEYKEYILMGYFQKLNKYLEERWDDGINDFCKKQVKQTRKK